MQPLYLNCPHSQENRAQFVYHQIEQWIMSQEMKALVAAFGGEVPVGNVKAVCDWLVEFSERWDYRSSQRVAHDSKTGEKARWLVDSMDLSSEQADLSLKAANKLGLVGIDKPMVKSYDYILVLGGARMTGQFRPRYAKILAEEHGIEPKLIALLASSRLISESERESTNTYAPNAMTEYDLFNKGAELEFSLSGLYTEQGKSGENINENWCVRHYEGYKVPLVSLSAPSSEPDQRRANSADTYRFLFEKFDIAEKSSLLLITSQIYVPYQQMEAIRVIAFNHNVYVETIGFPFGWGNTLVGMQQPENYLQEIRSVVQSCQRFLMAF